MKIAFALIVTLFLVVGSTSSVSAFQHGIKSSIGPLGPKPPVTVPTK